MDSRKKIRILGAANLGLLLLLVYGLFLSPRFGGRFKLPFAQSGRAQALSRLLPLDDPRELLLEGNQEVRLRREGEDWLIIQEGVAFPADSSKVERLIQVAREARILTEITDNPELWERFGLGGSSAVQLPGSPPEQARGRIVFTSSQGRGEILLGDPEEGQNIYVRFPGSKGVQLLSGNLAFYTERTPAYWSRLRLFPSHLAGRDVGSINIRGEVDLFIFRETTAGGLVWVQAGGGELANQQKADALADALARFSGTQFAPDLSDLELEEPFLEISFSTADGGSWGLTLRHFAGGKEIICQGYENGEALPWLYELNSTSYGRIEKLIEALLHTGDE